VLFTAMKLAGAIYLVYLGVRALMQRKEHSMASTLAPTRTTRRAVADGFLVGVANPKTAVFFAAVLPQFVNRPAGHVPAQMLLLGFLFVLIALLSDSAWAAVAGGARSWFGRSPRRMELIGGAGGLAMIGLGITLAVTGRRDEFWPQRSRSGTRNPSHTARQTALTSSPSARAWFTVRSPSPAMTWSLATLSA